MRKRIDELRVAGGGSARQEPLDELRVELEFHASLEETYVYPVLERFDDMRSWIRMLWESHDELRQLIEELAGCPEDDAAFATRLSRLSEAIEKHVGDEEMHVYPNARLLAGDVELGSISRNIEAAIRKRQAA
ncbi:MAG: hemerythrin domain-containing protein [Oligoflexia bacterium]|nr:hemerythrin domain-containing protein [Oligoflexia bacterium]